MTLAQFLDQQNLTDTAFAAQIGVSSEAVRRYRIGARLPKRDLMARIVVATGGAVQPTDFFIAPAAVDAGLEVAAVVPDSKAASAEHF